MRKKSAEEEKYVQEFARRVAKCEERKNKRASQIRASSRFILEIATPQGDVKDSGICFGCATTGGEIVRRHTWGGGKPCGLQASPVHSTDF